MKKTMNNTDTMTIAEVEAMNLYRQFKEEVEINAFNERVSEDELWDDWYRPEIEYLWKRAKEKEEYDIMLIDGNGGEEFPVKGVTIKHDRWSRTKFHKKKTKAINALHGRKEWAEVEKPRWVTKQSCTISKVRRQEGAKAIRNWRDEYDSADVALRNSYQWRYWEDDSDFLYNLRVWEEDEALWQEAWAEKAEAEYWERVEASDWEEMRTYEEVREFYEEEDGLGRDVSTEDGLGHDVSNDTGLDGLGHDTEEKLFPEPTFGVTYEDYIFTADSEKGAAWLYDRLRAFYGDVVKFHVAFSPSPVVPHTWIWNWEYTITVEGHTFTVIGEEGFWWLHLKLRAFYEVDFDVRIVNN